MSERRYGLTRTLIGERLKPSSASAMKAGETSPWSASRSLATFVIVCLACQAWSRNCSSPTSLYAGMRCQNGPDSSCLCSSVDGSTGGFLATMGSGPWTILRLALISPLLFPWPPKGGKPGGARRARRSSARSARWRGAARSPRPREARRARGRAPARRSRAPSSRRARRSPRVIDRRPRPSAAAAIFCEGWTRRARTSSAAGGSNSMRTRRVDAALPMPNSPWRNSDTLNPSGSSKRSASLARVSDMRSTTNAAHVAGASRRGRRRTPLPCAGPWRTGGSVTRSLGPAAPRALGW